jgi:hypothetical protein
MKQMSNGELRITLESPTLDKAGVRDRSTFDVPKLHEEGRGDGKRKSDPIVMAKA